MGCASVALGHDIPLLSCKSAGHYLPARRGALHSAQYPNL